MKSSTIWWTGGCVAMALQKVCENNWFLWILAMIAINFVTHVIDETYGRK